MTETDYERFKHALGMLAVFYPNSKPDLGVVTMTYFERLAVLTIEEVGGVLTSALDTCKFFPTIAELRSLGHVDAREKTIRTAQDVDRERRKPRGLPRARNTAEDAETLRHMRETLSRVLPGWQIPDPDESPMH